MRGIRRIGGDMGHEYLDFDLAIARDGAAYAARVVASPGGEASAPFTLPFSAADLAQFMVAVGPPRVSSRRLVPAAARVVDVKEYGTRLGQALLAGDVDAAFRRSLAVAAEQGRDLRVRLRLDGAPELDPVPWEYLYDARLDRFLTLSQETPLVRLMESLERPRPLEIDPPLRVLVLISSPTDMPALAVEREEQLLRATTGDLVKSGQLELVVLETATLSALQRALIEDFHVLHFIGHGGFDTATQEGVLVLEREDGTAHRVSASRLGTLLHDARAMQLAVLNACEGARSSGRDAFSGVAQELVRRGLPAVVAMQTEISDRAALVFTHEFYWFLTQGLPIDAAICEVRKAMATSDEASEWGTAVLLRSGTDQPFTIRRAAGAAPPREEHWEALYEGAQGALATGAAATALTMLEQLNAERPDYQDVTQLIERVRPEVEPGPAVPPPRRPETGAGEGLGSTGSAASEPPAEGRQEPAEVGPGGGGHTVTERRPRMGLLVGGGVVVLALVGGLVWNTLRGDEPDGTATTAPVVTAGPTINPTTDPTTAGTGATDALAVACGPAPTGPLPVGGLPVGCAIVAPTIDGNFTEWADLPAIRAAEQVYPSASTAAFNPSQVPLFSSSWNLLWDQEALFLHAVVTDPVFREVDPALPGQFYRGDGISFEFGPDARDLPPSERIRDGVDRHVMIGLGPDGAAASANLARGRVFSNSRPEPGITAAAVRTAEGYEVEVRAPWSALGWRRPRAAMCSRPTSTRATRSPTAPGRSAA